MKLRQISPKAKVAGLALVVGLLGLAAGYGLAGREPTAGQASPAAQSGGREVLYWYDPMVPNQRFDKPGKSPFMDMDLVPKYADEAGEEAGVAIDPALTQNLGARLATVERGTLGQTVSATGVIDFNERQVAVVQSRSGGYVERTYRRAPGDVIRSGAPIADIYIPEWASAQSEFLALTRTGEPELIAAGRNRMRLAGMPPGLISDVERSGRPRPIHTVTAPIGGVVRELQVRRGMTVSQGQTLAEINGLSPVWLNVAVPESQAGLVRVGQSVNAIVPAYPGETFSGRVTAVLPETDAESRTLEVRVELPNGNVRLRPGMYANAEIFAGGQRQALLVPSEAVIRTGRRNLVMLALPGGRYQPAEVRVGREANGRTEILAGLREGERVVASGQFLLESEASLGGVEARTIDQSRTDAPAGAAGQAPASPNASAYQTRGRIEALSAGSATLSHQPVPALSWPAMTMHFKLASPSLAEGLRVGDQVEFVFEQRPEGPVVTRMTKAGPQ